MCLGIPGLLIAIDPGASGTGAPDPLDLTGTVEFGGIRKQVRLAYTPEARVGDYVVVHAGIALSVVQEEEARRIFQALEELEGGGSLA
jgi:hydrogenase expression/formation protein HypC